MIDMFTTLADPSARETAWWYPIFGDLKTYKPMKVQNMNESGKSYGTVSENMDSSRNMLYLRTRYPYEYEVKQHILYRAKWYEITDIRPRDLPTMGLFRNQEFIISLIEVNYGRDFSE